MIINILMSITMVENTTKTVIIEDQEEGTPTIIVSMKTRSFKIRISSLFSRFAL